MYMYVLQAESMQEEYKFREKERVLRDITIRSGYEAPVPKQAEWVLLIVGYLYSWGANKHMYYSGSIQLCGNELAVVAYPIVCALI